MILNIETATTNCSVCVADQGKVVALKEFNSKDFSHSEQLHLFVEEVLVQSSCSKEALTAVAVSKGPGSYTGLRIGVSAAKGLCFALDLPLIAVSTLESLAHQVKAEQEGLIITALDARRDEIYTSVFNTQFQLVDQTQALVVEENSFDQYQGTKLYFIGPGAEKCQVIAPVINAEYFPNAVPSAKEMARLSYELYQKESFEDVAYFEPFYLKDFVVTVKKKA